MRSCCIGQGQVLVYKGPLMDRPGAFVRIAVAWDDSPLTQGCGALLPWDVQWCVKHQPSPAQLFQTKLEEVNLPPKGC